MAADFDALIIGSGFGGSVVAARLAAAGMKVCVLERGKAYPPGSFARSPAEMSRNFWDPSAGLYGLFNVWSFSGIDAIVSSGLGGGSLIYANVLIRKDQHWFKEDDRPGGLWNWPVQRAELDPHYDRVETALGANPYPFDAGPPFNGTAKTLAFKKAAASMSLDWRLPNLAVTFANPGHPPVPGDLLDEKSPNLHGRTRTTCRLCGECDIGCNYGSKNTLDYTYLTSAKRDGAEIRTLAEVRRFSPDASRGYWVEYVSHDPDRKQTSAPQRLTAARLILAAGTFGSTFLLLRNRDQFPNLSRAVGTRFSGNGDLLSFAVRGRHGLDPGRGPVITSAIRVGDSLDGGNDRGRGFYLQDAGYPEFLSWLVEVGAVPVTTWRLIQLVAHRLWDRLRRRRDTDMGAEIAALLGEGKASSGVLPLLGMGRDVPGGRMELSADGRLALDWTLDQSRSYFERVERTAEQIAAALEATFVRNPLGWLKRVITVHPLGGCPMGWNDQEGVVDRWGRVFGYDNFYIADGSVMPGPVGPNPSLTIAALADRLADGILDHSLTR